MAKDGVQIIRDIGGSITPIVVGLVLVSNQTLIPFFAPAIHLWVGLATAIVGGVDAFNRFFGGK